MDSIHSTDSNSHDDMHVTNVYGGSEEDEIHIQSGPLREQDRFLPIANVAKIMKKGVPEGRGKIAKDAKETLQECVSEYISFITSEASDRCLQERRKTINGEDILQAMQTLGFENYVEPLRLFLSKFREISKYDRSLVDGDQRDIDLSSSSRNTGLEPYQNSVRVVTCLRNDETENPGYIYSIQPFHQ
ncbi:unnamed protein product [Didymodactylos carnosus]|uniref:Nuclear transcription factor Y subunit beta n=1 Tax=Didymodactylos carnosus TaxID=1234261 RepID=A0A815XB68_9BILA|nr:unnamed protein product [Didymodactylos carnosus]CAF1555300.1 unnamed protein product [Didymodactylos carnosus]CAF4290240.1 unnamed protein product [Didymodactylos carnosus]CAF4416448.1 unnamed protein product [Didymodactylos carnosus]